MSFKCFRLGKSNRLVADFGRDGFAGVDDHVAFEFYCEHFQFPGIDFDLVRIFPRVAVGLDSCEDACGRVSGVFTCAVPVWAFAYLLVYLECAVCAEREPDIFGHAVFLGSVVPVTDNLVDDAVGGVFAAGCRQEEGCKDCVYCSFHFLFCFRDSSTSLGMTVGDFARNERLEPATVFCHSCSTGED